MKTQTLNIRKKLNSSFKYKKQLQKKSNISTNKI